MLTINWTEKLDKDYLRYEATLRIDYFSLITLMLLSACSSVDPVMSKAGVLTHPDCGKFSTEEAVATCEAGLRQRGGNSRFTFGFGFSRQL